MSDDTTTTNPTSELPDTTNEPTNDSETAEEAAKKALQSVNKSKTRFLNELLLSFDKLIYTHICYLYYLDNSFFWFLARGGAQLFFLTPKPKAVVPPPLQRPALIFIVAPSLACFLVHILNDAPTGSEAMGGYLHGGLVIDFIGQEGPISKIRLCLLDVWLLILQLIMLSLAVISRLPDSPSETSTSQDLDSEERGVRASSDISRSQNATGQNSAIMIEPDVDEESPLFSTSARPEEVSQLWDIYAGELVVADVNVLRTSRELWSKKPETVRGRHVRR